MPPRSIVHVITGLDTGGAETMLANLLKGTNRALWRPAVVSLRGGGPLADEIERLGVPVVPLGARAAWQGPAALWRLRSALRAHAPVLLVGWMYHGSVAAWLGQVVSGWRPVVWNLRYTPDQLSREKPGTAAMVRLAARLSGRPARIIYNSRAAAERHAQLGYVDRHAVVLPNGFDTARFVPSAAARATWRARLRVTDEMVVVGRIGRYHPMKDFPGFLAAAAALARDRPNVRFVLAGQGLDADNAELTRLIARLELGRVVQLLGEVRAMPDLYAALDIACSSSAYGEAFPNVVAEAMACGVPCVTTDVGDSAAIVARTGVVVSPRDPEALAVACRALVDAGPEHRAHLGAQARSRIIEHFSLGQVVGRYETLFTEVTA